VGRREMTGTSLWIEYRCPEHGLERFKIKVIKKYNVNPELIAPKFRTRPKYELSSVVVGRNVKERAIEDYLVQYFQHTGLIDKVVSMRLQL
jgi:hypothetical protein